MKHSPILYFSMCVCLLSVCPLFFSATAEPFDLKFGMVLRNSAGKILSKFLGPMVEYLPSYGIIRGFEGVWQL